MNATRANAPAFPLPGTNYQAQLNALSKPDVFLSPPNAGISLREHVSLSLLMRRHCDPSHETNIREAFKAADLFLQISEETAPKAPTVTDTPGRN